MAAPGVWPAAVGVAVAELVPATVTAGAVDAGTDGIEEAAVVGDSGVCASAATGAGAVITGPIVCATGAMTGAGV
jgi:hypothetical protein